MLLEANLTSAGPSTTVTAHTVSTGAPFSMWVVTPLWVDTRTNAVPTRAPVTSPVFGSTVTEPVPSSAVKVYAAVDFAPPSPTTATFRLTCSCSATVSAAGSVTSAGAASTLTLQTAFLPLKVLTVIFALPGATPVTTPSASTTATAALEEV